MPSKLNLGAQIHRFNSNTKPTKYTIFQQLPYHLKPENIWMYFTAKWSPIYEIYCFLKVLRLLPSFTLVTALCSWWRALSFRRIMLQGETEVLGSNCVPLPLRPPQISYSLTWIRTQASAVTDCVSHGLALKTWSLSLTKIIYKTSVPTSQKTLRLRDKKQTVKTTQRHKGCLSWQSDKIHKYRACTNVMLWMVRQMVRTVSTAL